MVSRKLTSYLLGFLAAMAMPPLYAFPLLGVAYSGLFLLLTSCTRRRQALLESWLFGLGFFMAGLYWMCLSLTIDIRTFGWLIPLALIGLNGLIACFPACAGWVFYHVRHHRHAWVLFALIFFVAEVARGHMFTGFPWNLTGYTWAFSAATLQLTHYINIYGLTLITLLAAVLPAVYYKGKRRLAVAGLAIVVLVMGAGALRLAFAPPTAFVEGVRLRLVQPNIPQAQKWDGKQAVANLRLLMRMSVTGTATHIIWPEAAIPFLMGEDADLGSVLADMLAPNQWLMAGTLRAQSGAVFNSLVAVNAQGVQAAYDKFHLVPFGEYVPFRGLLPMEKIAPSMGDLSRGQGLSTMTLAGIPPFSPLICYEVIFPRRVTDGKAKWLLTITNDAWFGRSTGPYQHFAMARVRAVEEGLPLVRVANTGISGVVDAYGRVVARIPLGTQDVLDVGLPVGLEP